MQIQKLFGGILEEKTVNSPANRFFMFDLFRLDTKPPGLLRYGEQEVLLTPKEIAILLFLVEQRERIVTKEELQGKIWPNTFVEEGNLARHITNLRKKIRKCAAGKDFIENRHGRGYRFVENGIEVESPILEDETHTGKRPVIQKDVDQPESPEMENLRDGREQELSTFKVGQGTEVADTSKQPAAEEPAGLSIVDLENGTHIGTSTVIQKEIDRPESPESKNILGRRKQELEAFLQVIWNRRIKIALLLLSGIVLVVLFVFRHPFLVPYDPCKKSVKVTTEPLTQIEVATVNDLGEMAGEKRRIDPQYHVENLPCKEEKEDEVVPLVMVKIDPGKSLMGARSVDPIKDEEGDEVPHEVNIGYTFYIGQYEVTRAQWWVVASKTNLRKELDLALDPSHFKGDDELPVEGINWYEAVEFCERLGKMTGNLYRLPTETEWEYACRAHTQTPFSFGNEIRPEWANYDWALSYNHGVRKDEASTHTVKVGKSGPANGFGLFDMHGNVWEFCQEWTNKADRKDDYSVTPNNGRPRERRAKDDEVIVRGGSWYKPPEQARSADRGYGPPNKGAWDTGFRVVMEKNVSTSQERKQLDRPK
ncbi:MAG: SUMF1/EgtB/PvdO family nonheme iron enzyme [Acidobacteriota bacterium]|nr:SUMF1/EgtB/PvdO family nonheme iron enzyme [Acidobacteriota bacterium]